MKKIYLAVAIHIFILIFSFNSAFAGLPVKVYLTLKKDDNSAIKMHIFGLVDGYMWSNEVQKAKGNIPLFCLPNNLTLNIENYISILDDEIEKQKKELDKKSIEELRIGLLLLIGIATTFPCK